MLEEEIRKAMKEQRLNPIDLYSKLACSKQNFYKAIRSSNLANKTLLKIIDFLDMKLLVSLEKKDAKEFW